MIWTFRNGSGTKQAHIKKKKKKAMKKCLDHKNLRNFFHNMLYDELLMVNKKNDESMPLLTTCYNLSCGKSCRSFCRPNIARELFKC